MNKEESYLTPGLTVLHICFSTWKYTLCPNIYMYLWLCYSSRNKWQYLPFSLCPFGDYNEENNSSKYSNSSASVFETGCQLVLSHNSKRPGHIIHRVGMRLIIHIYMCKLLFLTDPIHPNVTIYIIFWQFSICLKKYKTQIYKFFKRLDLSLCHIQQWRSFLGRFFKVATLWV